MSQFKGVSLNKNQMAQSDGNAQYHQIAVKLGFIHLRVQTGDLWGNRCHPPKFIQVIG